MVGFPLPSHRTYPHLLRAPRTVGIQDEEVDEVQEVDQQRMVELLELLAPVEMDGDQPLDVLRLQTPDHLVVVVLDAKHAVDFVLRLNKGLDLQKMSHLLSNNYNHLYINKF